MIKNQGAESEGLGHRQRQKLLLPGGGGGGHLLWTQF